MPLTEFLNAYWWALIPYFFIGFAGFYIVTAMQNYSNGALGDLFVAIMWGFLWPIFGTVITLVSALAYIEKKLSERFARRIPLLQSIPFCAWCAATGYLALILISASASMSAGTIVVMLFWTFVGYALWKRITAPPATS